MAARNYYVILGVASDETDQGVRAAFRDLAKRYHPDHVGPEGAGPFREVAEAYEVLGDPSRRRQYDESLKPGPARPLRGCIGCEGTGTVEGERAVAVDLPPMSGRGTTFVVPLTGLGVHNFYLRVRVRVDKTTEPPSTEAQEA